MELFIGGAAVHLAEAVARTLLLLNNLGAPGVLISENATITGGTIMGSHDYDTAIILTRIAIW